MAYTFKNPSESLQHREQPEAEASSQLLTPGIPLEDWEQFQHALAEALRPFSEARTAVAYAIRDLQLRIGRTM